MPNRSLRLSLLVFAAIPVGCGTDEVFNPTPPVPRVFTTLLITPTDYTLVTVATANTLQLAIRAYDGVGSPIRAYDGVGSPLPGTGAVTYSSSAPAIASVSRSGVVTAAARGTAEITAALTLGGVTLTASMTARVQTFADSDVSGVYDLTALITSFDPVWGDVDGYRFEAVLTLSEESGPPWLRGTYRVLHVIGPGGDSVAVTDTGDVTVSYDFASRLVVALGDRQPFGLTLIVATLASGFIDGTFGCCAHISGTFEARRRRP